MHCLRVSDIDWCESAGNYVRIHLGTRTFTTRLTMGVFAMRLRDHRFARISRTTVVNIDRIVDIQSEGTGDHIVRLAGGTSRRLSRSYRDDFLNRFVVL